MEDGPQEPQGQPTINGFDKPNYTQVPNALFDLLPEMGYAELKVVLVAIRHIAGWHKTEDQISVSQFQAESGLSRQAAWEGILAAVERATLSRVPRSGQNMVYRLRFKADEGTVLLGRTDDHSTKENGSVRPTRTVKPFALVDHSTKENGAVRPSRTEPFYLVEPQKKGNKGKKSTSSAQSRAAGEGNGEVELTPMRSVKQQELDQLFEAAAASIGIDRATMSRTEKGKWYHYLAELRDAGVTVAEVASLVAMHRAYHPDIPVEHPGVLANKLSFLRSGQPVPERDRPAAPPAGPACEPVN